MRVETDPLLVIRSAVVLPLVWVAAAQVTEGWRRRRWPGGGPVRSLATLEVVGPAGGLALVCRVEKDPLLLYLEGTWSEELECAGSREVGGCRGGRRR